MTILVTGLGMVFWIGGVFNCPSVKPFQLSISLILLQFSMQDSPIGH